MQKALKKYGQKHALDDLFNLIMKQMLTISKKVFNIMVSQS